MRLLSANHFFLPFLLAWTCLLVAASPLPVFPVSKAGTDAVIVQRWESLPFEGIFAGAKEKAKAVLKDVANTYPDIPDQVQHVQEQLNKIVEYANNLKRELAENNIDLTVVHDYLNREAAKIVENIRKEFDKPSLDEMDERAIYRNQMISRGLDHLEDAFAYICVKSGHMTEQDARQIFAPVKTAIQDGLLIAGNIVDKHPELAKAMIITVVCFIVPESFILRPILSVFGFGPAGPVKGSLAAWMQRTFWGGAVAKNSWFAFLQRAGMVTKVVGKF